jgi:hypothetical protein
MTTRRYFSLTENARHKGSISIVAAGTLALMLGGLAGCGQGGQQDQTSQMQGQAGQQSQGDQQQRRKQGTQ